MRTRHVLVVGAGVVGLLTAVECVLAGHRVTVLDRGAIPNPESSSFDEHRAIRTLVPGDPVETRRRVVAHRRWLELEAVLCQRFYRRVGVVTARPRASLRAATRTAVACGVPVEPVEPAALPHLAFPAAAAGLLERDAGVLLADRVLHAAATWLARRRAATLRPWTAVRAIDAGSARVTLAAGDTLSADLLLIAAGPWSAALAGGAGPPVVLHRQTMAYLRPPGSLASWWEAAPAAGGLGAAGRAWLLPPGAGARLKISSDAVCRRVDAVFDAEPPVRWVDRLRNESPLSDVDQYEVVTVKHCHYAADPVTGGALLSRIGPATWSRAACGGTGFTSAPLVADRIARAIA